jgi:uncharacterized radical SAM superfamily protein
MQNLNTKPNILKPDDVYEVLITAHNGLSKEQSDAMNARLILILLNHIGDEAVIREAVALAQK